MSPRLANLLTILGLVALFAGVSFSAPRWARYFQRPLALEGEPQGARGGSVRPEERPLASPSPDAQRTINVKLFFEAADRPGLVLEERAVEFSNDLARQIRLVVEELIKGSRSALLSPVNPGTKVLEVFITAQGVAYVDLSKEILETEQRGSDAELFAAYSIVNSISDNFPAIRRVQILVDDHPAETLAGHVDLSRPLVPDLTLLAREPASPSPPEASPAS
jgi:germination protein M